MASNISTKVFTDGFTRNFTAKISVTALDVEDYPGEVNLVVNGSEFPLGFKLEALVTDEGNVLGFTRSDQPATKVYSSVSKALEREMEVLANELANALSVDS